MIEAALFGETIMPMEFERVFLVREKPDLASRRPVYIEQHYLSTKSGGLRLRKADDSYELTKKIPVKGGDSHDKLEINIPLDHDEFLEQKRLSKRFLTKARFYLPKLRGTTSVEYNVFTGNLTGLVMIEVEFASKAAKKAFKPPAWFDREVTDEAWASNSWLAGRTFAEVKPHLK